MRGVGEQVERRQLSKLVAGIHQRPYVTRQRRHIARDVNDAWRTKAGDAFERFAGEPGAWRIQDQSLRTERAAILQVRLHGLVACVDQSAPVGSVASQVRGRHRVAFNGDHGCMTVSSGGDGKEAGARIEIHDGTSAERGEDVCDQRLEQVAVALEEGLRRPADRPGA